MATNLTTKAPLDLRNVLNMIDMSVGEEQEFWVRLACFEPLARPVRRIKQDPALGRGNEIAVGFKDPAAESFVSEHVSL